MKKQPHPKTTDTTQSDQTRGQYERDPKGRTGHFTGAGDPSIKQAMGRRDRKRATPQRGGK